MADIENEIISKNKLLHTPPKKRMEWVDYARGMAIILVVFRHSMVGLNRSGLTVPDFLYAIQEFVYNFRMPVFFVLSGIFLAKSLAKKNIASVLHKKVTTLLYPYLLWTVVFITIQILLSNYTNSYRTPRDYLYIVTQPRNLDHMWYILALFNTSALLILLSPWLIKRPALHILIGVCLHISSYFFRDYSLFSDLCYYYIFLVIGTVVSEKLTSSSEDGNKKLLFMLLGITPVFIIGQLLWLKLTPGNLAMQLLFLDIILIACIFFYLLCKILYNARFFRGLINIGKHSLYIYILHLLVISSLRIFMLQVLGFRNVYVIIFLSLVLGIALPMLIYNAGKKWGIGYLFSLDGYSKKNYA